MEVGGKLHAPITLLTEKCPKHPMKEGLLGRRGSLDRRFEKVVLPLWGILSQFLGHSAGSSVAIPTRLTQLPSKRYVEINTTEANEKPEAPSTVSEENQSSQ
jgi:hypothetical protein